MVTNQKSSKVVVLITGMISLIYAMANPIIYGTMSMRYRLAYKKVFTAAFGLCERRARSWSLSLSSISTPRSRTFTLPQLFSGQTSDENKNKEAVRKQENQHGQTTKAIETKFAQNDHVNELSYGVTGRTIQNVPTKENVT